MQRFVPVFFLTVALALAQAPEGAKPAPAKARKNHAPEKVPARFRLWESQQELRSRAGAPDQYFVAPIQKVIPARELGYYNDTYKKIDDVFYRETSAGRVRILVGYAQDESQSHLDPVTRVEKLHFIFDQDVSLRPALAAIDELRELCDRGCILNGFSSSVIAQPETLNDAQLLVAQKMKRHWKSEMTDATPGAQVYYKESPYPVDFERSPVERIDLTLVSNASQEHYGLTITKTDPTVLDVWNPHRHKSAAMPAGNAGIIPVVSR